MEVTAKMLGCRVVTISDFQLTIIMAKGIQNSNIIAISINIYNNTISQLILTMAQKKRKHKINN